MTTNRPSDPNAAARIRFQLVLSQAGWNMHGLRYSDRSARDLVARHEQHQQRDGEGREGQCDKQCLVGASGVVHARPIRIGPIAPAMAYAVQEKP